MKTIIGGIAVIWIIWFVIFVINKITDHFTAPENDQVSIPTNTHRATGCKSFGACQNMHLGKANDAGYDTSQYTFCNACNDFTLRIDNCPSFYPRGCKTGVCAYSDHGKNGPCFCSLYNQPVVTRESCPDYLDFFDTAAGQDLLNSLEKK